jgi:hypothetical protein
MTETLVRLLGLYYLAEGGISAGSRVVGYLEYLTGDNGYAYPKGYFWSYFYSVFPLALGILILLYSKQLTRWMHRGDSVASDD